MRGKLLLEARTKMSSPRTVTIVHLSDIQFGRNHRFGHLAPTTEDSFDTLVGRLQEDLEGLRMSHDLIPDLLVLTGDLAEWGRKSEFKDVEQFLSRMAGGLGLKQERVLLVPGNHDVNRSACEAYFKNCEADEELPKEPYWRKLEHYAEFFQRYYSGVEGIHFDEKQPWTLYELRDLQIVVAGLNSTWKESHRPEDHYGWVGEKQLRWFAERLRAYKERGWMRIGLVHHNVLRRAMEDNENLRDADDLHRLLGLELNLLLHGHTHEGRLGWLGRVPVLSTGSASVIRDARPQEVPNQYQVICLFPDRIWFGTRQYAPDQKRWIGDTRSSIDGNQWFHEERVNFENIGETFAQKDAAETASIDHLATIVASYRAFVADTFRHQTLYDICSNAEDQDIPGGLALLDIFVPQAVHPKAPPRDLPSYAKPWETLAQAASFWKEEGFFMPAEQALLNSEQPWAVLLGSPGAGKTSLTRWLCLKLCTAGESLPQLSSELVPVRVEMRRFDERYRAATMQGRSYDFFDYLDQEHAEKSLALRGAPLRELKVRGRLMWLFDGMDEVSDVTSRQRYAEMIVGLQRAEPSRGIITSRIVGARPVLPCFQAAEIPVYTLLDFDEGRIREFITRWHEKAFLGSIDVRRSRQVRLEQLIAESRPVRDLCGNPLLLTMIALLNRGGELPRRRHVLYRRAVELMAAQWEANKHLQNAEMSFELEDKIEFLRALAWWMQFELEGGRRNLVGEEELIDFTSRFFQKHQGKSSDQAQRYARLLIGQLRERNYILARIGENLFGFVHKTFLEYLVAESIRSRFAGRQIEIDWLEGLYRQHWRDSDWHEVLTLICGMLDENQPAHVVTVLQAILPEIEIVNDASMRFATFAVHCLVEVRQLDQEPIKTFMLRLAEFAQNDLVRYEPHGGGRDFVNSIHMIGSRWPEHDIWRRWAIQYRSDDPSVRVAANICAIETVLVEQQLPLLVLFMEGEREEIVISQMLAHVRLEESQIRALLAGDLGGGEGARCSVACAVAQRDWNVWRSDFSKDLVVEARQVMSHLLAHSNSQSIKIRVALNLAGREADPMVQAILLECIRDASSAPSQLVLSIHALERFAQAIPQLLPELRNLWIRTRELSVRLAVVGTFLEVGAIQEGLALVQDWLSRDPSERIKEGLVSFLTRYSKTHASVKKAVENWRESGSIEASRHVAIRVNMELNPSDDVRKGIPDLSLKGLLREIKYSNELVRQLILARESWRFREMSDEQCSEVRKVLREMVALNAMPMSRLQAARVMRDLSLVPAEEWREVFRLLANSSTDEMARLHAARMLGHEGSPFIEVLATSATNAEVRAAAENASRSLRLRFALHELGRPPTVLPW